MTIGGITTGGRLALACPSSSELWSDMFADEGCSARTGLLGLLPVLVKLPLGLKLSSKESSSWLEYVYLGAGFLVVLDLVVLSVGSGFLLHFFGGI